MSVQATIWNGCVWVVPQEQNVSGTADCSVFCLTGNTPQTASVLRAAPAGGVLFFLWNGANLVAAYVMGCFSSNIHTCD